MAPGVCEKRHGKLAGNATVDGLKDVPGAATACPGTALYARLKELRTAPTVTAYEVCHPDGHTHGRFKSIDTAMERVRKVAVQEGGASVKKGRWPATMVS